MKPFNLLTIIGLFISISGAMGQSIDRHVIGATGNHANIGGVEYAFTFGESLVGTTSSDPLLTKGFHQPDSIFLLSVNLIAVGAYQAGDNVEIHWRLANDTGAGRFIIERADQNLIFQPLDTLSADLSLEEKYQYADSEIPHASQLLIYRIRHLRPNGSILISNRVYFQFQGNSSWQVFPNPVKDKLTVILGNQEANQDLTFTLLDITGRVVWNHQIPSGQVSQPLQMTVSKYAPGMYTLTMAYDQGIFAQKIMILKQ